MADNKTFMEVPPNIEDPLVLRRFLLHLIENIDRAFGNRGQSAFTDASQVEGISENIAEEKFQGQVFSNIKRYSEEFNLTNDRDLIDAGFLFENSTNNPEQSSIADGAYTLVNPGLAYDENDADAMDQGIKDNSDKINEILVALRNADIIEV